MKYVTSNYRSSIAVLGGIAWLTLHSAAAFAQTQSPLPAGAASAAAEAVATGDMPLLIKAVLVIMTVLASLLSVLILKKALNNADWPLKDALTEETTLTAWTVDPQTNVRTPLMSTPVAGGVSTPVMVTELRASTSRLIALIGMIVIVILFVGFGIILMYRFATSSSFPSQAATEIVTFLLGGASLFAPYVFNKFAGALTSKAP